MKLFLPFALISFVSSQSFIWTWVSGNPPSNQQGNYAIKGSPSPQIVPRARIIPNGVIHPQTNELVIFGGSPISNSYLNDLWTFNFNTSMWTWWSGSSVVNQVALYGNKGTPSSNTMPGSRSEHKISIHPVSGLLFVFGGSGYVDTSTSTGYLCDLWTFNFNTRQWTWIAGLNTLTNWGVYGTKGAPSASIYPGARRYHSLHIHPRTGNVIVFAGCGYGPSSTGNYGALNDLWSFSMSTRQWTWIGGAADKDQPGVYGTKGVASAASQPGSRCAHSSDIDPSTGKMFIFGGASASGENLNDLWSYDFTSQRWTWLSGSDMGNQAGIYGTIGVASPNNSPRSRAFHAMSSAQGLNSLLIFGGRVSVGLLNDLWLYNLTSNEWTWVGGSQSLSPAGNYGTLGVPSTSNVPGGRYAISFTCMGKPQQCSLYSGYNFNVYFSDVWVLDLSPSIQKPTLTTRSDVSTNTPSILKLVSSTAPHSSILLFTPSSQTFAASNSIASSRTSSSTTSTNGLLSPSSDKIWSTFMMSNLNTSSNALVVYLSELPVELSTNRRSTTRNRASSENFTKFIWTVENIVFLVLSFLGVAVILSILFRFYTRRKHTQKLHFQPKSSSTAGDDSHNLSNISTFSRVTSIHATTVFTHVPSNQGIAIPGFLQFKPNEDFLIDREIARGGFGTINLGIALNPSLKHFGDVIIVKQIRKPQISDIDKQIFYQEVSLMHFLREYENIAKIIGFSDEPLCLLMKYYKCGSLDKYIYSSQCRKSRVLILEFLIDINTGVKLLHSKGLVHCDLKPQNVLLDWDERSQRLYCVLTDFGITQIISSENLLVHAFRVVNVNGASISYAAPEAILRLRRRQEISARELNLLDIYATGVIIYELLNRCQPYRQ